MTDLTTYGADEARFEEASKYTNAKLGRVISQYRGLYRVITEETECFAEVSGRFRHETLSPSDFPCVGDFVTVKYSGESSAVIQSVLSRKSLLARRGVGNENVTQNIAANVDVVFVCMSLNSNFNLNRLERYLSAIGASGAEACIVLTKSDLCTDAEAAINKAAPSRGNARIFIASKDIPLSVGEIRRYMQPSLTYSFVGSSGVGKSTLINALAGEDVFAVSETRSDDKGRHTTTNRQLCRIPCGALLIDTPGMREFGVEASDVGSVFTDIEELAAHCRFSDCTHESEPGCAVLAATKDGSLDERRLGSYKKLLKETKYDGLSSRELETAKLNDMFKNVGGMKGMRKNNRKNDKRKKGYD